MIALLLAEWTGLVPLMVCSAFFFSAETALFSLNTTEIHRLRPRQLARNQAEEVLGLATTEDILAEIVGRL